MKENITRQSFIPTLVLLFLSCILNNKLIAQTDSYVFHFDRYKPGEKTSIIMGKGQYSGRRCNFTNASMVQVYASIYGFDSSHIRNDLPLSETKTCHENLFCFDFIVPKGKESELYQFMEKKLEDFDVKAKVEKIQDVNFLIIYRKQKTTISHERI